MDVKVEKKHSEVPEETQRAMPSEAGAPAGVQETPLPTRQMAALVVVLLNESICASMLFPIVGYLVAELESESTNQAGYLSGLLVGVFQFGQVVSGKVWGRFSDVYGRKPALMFGAAMSGVVMLMFGLSTSLWFCIVLRFLHGLCNGNVLVAKAMIADITDKSNEAKGFTLVSLAWGIGSMLGPFIGGFLYDPSDSMALQRLGFHKGGFFDHHKALLPSILIFLYGEIAFVAALFLIKESNRHARPVSELLQWWKDSFAAFYMRWLRRGRSAGGNAMRVPTTDEEATQREERSALTSAVQAEDASGTTATTVAAHPSELKPIVTFGYREAFTHRRTRIPLILYFLLSGSDIAYWETFPLWSIASKDAGGLEWSTSLIGTVVILNAIPCVMANVVFPKVRQMFGNDMKMWKCSVLFGGLMIFLLPFSSSVKHPLPMVLLASIARTPPLSWCFSMSFLLIARSSPKEHVGAMNGIGQSVGCLMRSITPPLVAPIFAWSIEPERFAHIFPFDRSLVFLIAALMLLATLPFSNDIEVETVHHVAKDATDVDHEESRVVLTPAHRNDESDEELEKAETLSL